MTRELPMTTERIETPMEAMDAPMIEGKKLVLAPILRAGLALADGMLELLPSARVAHVGLYRDPKRSKRSSTSSRRRPISPIAL